VAEIEIVERRSTDIPAAILAGIVAGLAFVVAEMLLVPMLLGGSAWGPPRMIGAIVLGEEVLPPPATFDAFVVLAAVAFHLLLSIVYAVIFALIARSWGLGLALIAGIVYGLIIYALNFYGMTALFPWFAEARNGVSICSPALFGAVLALVYKTRQRVPAVAPAI
jgi:uncharacterized membrane protein YagU involved in acid resistance